ncbi:inactive Rho GTPase-activating protein 11B-like [Culicoides brevitarsis]|uniref:inactive Rho GTPase-activating protein 11B-like n=1 Tax=Culicoides brevitarsis TaxID=469753 RepID=UPI00307C7606
MNSRQKIISGGSSRTSQGTILSKIDNPSVLHAVIVEELKQNDILTRYKAPPPVSCSSSPTKTFKVPLEQCPLSSYTLKSGHQVLIPTFLANAYDLINNSLETEGLFRISGNLQSQKRLFAAIQKDPHAISKEENIHDVTGLVKQFFRDLPTAILGDKEMQDTLTQCMKTEIYASRCMRVALLMLPPLHLYTLTSFLQLLRKISLHANENKMDSYALAVCVTPNLMPVVDKNELGKLSGFIDIVKILIENANKMGVVMPRTLRAYIKKKSGKDEII